jgi:hypothetical protein
LLVLLRSEIDVGDVRELAGQLGELADLADAAGLMRSVARLT